MQASSLSILLTWMDKEECLVGLEENGYRTLQDIVKEEDDSRVTIFDKPIQGVSKMKLRLIYKRAQQVQELALMLEQTNKLKYLLKLLQADVTTLEGLLRVDDKDPRPVPKMISRVLIRDAEQRIQARELTEFLHSIQKQEFLQPILRANITTPEQLGNATVEKLQQEQIPASVARICIRKAQAASPPNNSYNTRQGRIGVPPYQKARNDILSQQATKEHIRTVHETIMTKQKSAVSSFGFLYYSTLIAMDCNAARIFAGVSLHTVGREFDDLIHSFVDALDRPKQFDVLSDRLVSRMVHYNIPLETLWMGSTAFRMAAILVAPEIDLMDVRYQTAWTNLYQAILPPLHPTLIRSTRLTSPSEWTTYIHEDSTIHQIIDALARRGYTCLTRWLYTHIEQDAVVFRQKLEATLHTLHDWQQENLTSHGEDTTSSRSSSPLTLWRAFEVTVKDLLEGMGESIEMKMAFLIELPEAINDLSSNSIADTLRTTLFIVAASQFGYEQLVSTLRDRQKELVETQWAEIFRFSSDDFSTLFYETFTKDLMVAHLFQNTPLRMQAKLFVHQLNSFMIRLNEDEDSVMRPALVELGARHRVYGVGSRELAIFSDVLMDVVAAMLGKSHWRSTTIDAWSYTLQMITTNMTVGWTFGVGLLNETTDNIAKRKTSKSVVMDLGAIRKLRKEAPRDFSRFFEQFAEALGDSSGHGGDPKIAASRYEEGTKKILEESDTNLIMDRIFAMGRRHRVFHGFGNSALLGQMAYSWMSIASTVFGEKFAGDVVVEWGLLWESIAFSMSPSHKKNQKCPSLQMLIEPHLPKNASIKMKADPIELTLKERTHCGNNTVLLTFEASQPLSQKAGQFAKLRWKLDGDRTVSRYYSIASCPDPTTQTSSEIQFFIKKVEGGRLSPYLVEECFPPASCQVLTTAGTFVLEKSKTDTRRLMVSAGVGIVAFISAIRSVVARNAVLEDTSSDPETVKKREAILSRDPDVLHRQLHLSLVHSERNVMDFVFLTELTDILRQFGSGDHPRFHFSLTLLHTGKSVSSKELQDLQTRNPLLKLYQRRVDRSILESSLQEFANPTNTPVYACGPGIFQRSIRDTILKQMGHSHKLLSLEFFDL